MLSFFLSKNRNLVVFLFLFILSISFMTFSSSKFSVSFKEIGETVIYPFRFVVISVSNGVSWVFSSFGDVKALREQLNYKQRELEAYQKKLFQYDQLLQENERFRKILKYKEIETLNVEIAQIISRDPENNFSSLTLDKGRKDGIYPGMPVVAYLNEEKGIVGVVAESAFFTSKVRTFLNRDSSFGVYLPQSGIHGVAQGLGDNKNIMTLLYIDKENPINIGEKILTSPEGDSFPPDIYIGNVVSIDTTDKTRLTHKIYIKPYIHLSKLKDVFVIKKNIGAEQ